MMRGWTSMLIGFALLCIAYWSYLTDGLGLSTMLCGAASLMFFYRGAQGRPATDGGDDPTALIDFVTDPADAIVDSATDKFAELFDSKRQPTATAAVAEPPAFDADAAFERYMAKRAAEPAPESAPAPNRGFGRKGLA